MKILIFILGSSIFLSCSEKSISYGDESLKIDIQKLSTNCECTEAIVMIMKEQILIQEEVVAGNCSHDDSIRINDDYIKRNMKFDELVKHCMPLYNEFGEGKCEINEEAEKLDKRLNELRKKTGMQ